MAKAKIAGADAELGLRLPLHIETGGVQSRCVESAACCGYPRPIRLWGPEETQCRNRGMALLDIGKPRLPAEPVVVQPGKAADAVMPQQEFAR